jgi:hypothetical protein
MEYVQNKEIKRTQKKERKTKKVVLIFERDQNRSAIKIAASRMKIKVA